MGVAQAIFADLGPLVFNTQHGSFDTHAGKLLDDASAIIGGFMDDLKEHDREEEAIRFAFSGFGGRIQDMGTGTDHASGGVSFVIGAAVEGGPCG